MSISTDNSLALNKLEHQNLINKLEHLSGEVKQKKVNEKIIILFLEEHEQSFSKPGLNFLLKNKLINLSNLAKDQHIDVQKKIIGICNKMDQFSSPLELLPAELIVHIAGFLGKESLQLRNVSNEIQHKLSQPEIMTLHLESILPSMKTKEKLFEYLDVFGGLILSLKIKPIQFGFTNAEIKELLSKCPCLKNFEYKKFFASKKSFFEYIKNYGYLIQHLDLYSLAKSLPIKEHVSRVRVFTKEEVTTIIEDCPNLVSLSAPERSTDEILENLVNLKKLTSLSLKGCYITDSGLDSLGEIKKQLINLDLSGCSYLSNECLSKNLRECNQLTELVLPKQTNDNAVASLNGMNRLHKLIFSNYTNIMECLPRDEPNDPYDPSRNRWIENGGMEYLKGLTKLEILDLSICRKVSNQCLSSVLKNLKLKWIKLPDQTDDSVIESLQEMRELGTLIVNNSSNLKYPAVGKLKNLETLNLSGCDQIENFEISNLLKLKNLNLAGCKKIMDTCLINGLKERSVFTSLQLPPPTNEDVLGILSSTKIRSLTLKYNKITSAGLHNIKNCEILKLSLKDTLLGEDTQLGNNAVTEIGKFAELKELKLDLKNVTDEGLASLGTLTNLTHLTLNRCHNITADGLRPLETLPQLSYVLIEDSKVSAEYKKEFAKKIKKVIFSQKFQALKRTHSQIIKP